MPTKNRNRRRRQNRKRAKQQKRKQTPSQVVRHQAADQKHPFNDLPDDLVKLILDYKKQMETWTVMFEKTLETCFNTHMQAKAVRGLMDMPGEMAEFPPWVRDGLVVRTDEMQEASDKWLSFFVTTYICTQDGVDAVEEIQEQIQAMKKLPHPRIAIVCRKALKLRAWSDFKKTLQLD